MPATLRCEIFPADLNATHDFYVDALNFEVTGDERSAAIPYLALRRGQIRLGAAARPDVAHHTRRPPTGVELVLEVDDVDAELARVEAAGYPVDEDITDRTWGLRDFRVTDPSCYYWRITNRR